MQHQCPLCQASVADDVIYTSSQLRVIWAGEPGYPCFARVVWAAHVAEMTELSPAQRTLFMDTVFTVEAVMRHVLAVEGLAKINLASFGNWVPHLHWHVIPRFTDDAHWPNSSFGAPSREGVAHAAHLRPALAAAIATALRAVPN